MPNLLVASGIFHPETGGPATYLKQILPALQARGWSPRVISYGEGDAYAWPYPLRRIPRRAYPLRRLEYALAARPLLSWADISYLHTIDLPLIGDRRAPRVIKIVGDQAWERCARKGWIPPGMTPDAFQHYRGDWRVRWQQASRSRQVAGMDAVIVPSRYLRDLVRGWGVAESKIHVIYNAISPRSAPLPCRDALRRELGWDQHPTLLIVARLQTWKGVDHCLGALATLPDMRLVIAGDGPDRPRLHALAAGLGERVEFTGALPRAQIQRLMLACDGLLLYSAYEGLSHTILEALQLGTPVLASDRGGNGELVRDGVNGLLIPHPDIEALRQGMLELARRRDELSQGAAAGLERFSFVNMVARTDALLTSLL